ncbi:MAG: N-acetylglucosamine-6-phosphate deacetylase, partial [Spirochaetaceae bacterium]|nr:N-acetylglucosamine-6-phosphate deacetylase [Spirochaetaceae bacterium]
LIDGGRFAALGPSGSDADVTIDAQGAYVAPGFVDVHVHGGGGRDFMEATLPAFIAATEHHLWHGTTAIVPTAVSAPIADLKRFLSACDAAIDAGAIRARILGAHLEGPYLSTKKAGAHHPDYLKNPDPAEYERLVADFPCLLRMTAAPELDGAFALGEHLHRHGVNASCGHSDASATIVLEAANHGFTSVTHLYNAMSQAGERDGRKQGGVVEATLLEDRLYAEVIADLRHVPAELVLLAYRNKGKEKLVAVSDCLSPAGMEAGRFRLGGADHGIDVDVREAAFVAGTDKLAGSIVSSDALLQNLLSLGIPVADAVWMLTKAPAALLGRQGAVGAIKIGGSADLVVFDAAGIVSHVICQGVVIR